MSSIYEQFKENFKSGKWSGYTRKMIFSELGITDKAEMSSIGRILAELQLRGEVFTVNGKYLAPGDAGYVMGTLRGNERGFAFFVAEDGKTPDMFIPNKSLHGALHKDKVLARKVVSDRGSSDEGEVVKILERGVTSLCGTYFKERDFGFVRPDDKNYFVDIYVPFKRAAGAKNYDKVLVDIYKFPENGSPEGQVKEIFGKRFDLKTEEISIIKGYGYKTDFPKPVRKEVSEIETEVKAEKIIGREDFRDRLIITIDGEDSRDFDDAVEVWKNDNGNYMLGVHIADVSEYVKPGSALDKEALARSTSVYFPDTVIPMLPKELSNGICSLNEGADRLTLSCIAEIDGAGEVVDKRICKSVIKSKKRMTYTEVQGIIDGDGRYISENKELVDMIRLMRELQLILSAKRDRRGSVDLDVRESHITISDGEITVEPRKSADAYKIIEEFMVVSNECVAEYAFYLDVPFVYRVHGKPLPEKARAFAAFVALIGLNVKWKAEEVRPSDFSAILNKLKGEPVYPVVNKIMLRSMQKAKYSTENEGHFGLSSKCYCHFTSPIRRYPDLVVHRVLKMLIDGRIGELIDLYADLAQKAATISSENERKADEVERAVDDLYKAYYMLDKVGEEFDGVISGVTPNGVYTELGNTVEGFTSLGDLPRGNYVYDERNYSLKSGKYSFALGDSVVVGVVGVDRAAKKVELCILENLSDEKRNDKMTGGEKARGKVKRGKPEGGKRKG